MPESAPAKSPAPMSPWSVLVGALLGVAAGLFFGDYASVVHPVGQIYVMLLEVAVYPYLVCSLLHGLGSMSPSAAARLFRVGWPFYLGLWVATFAVLWLLTLGVPETLPIALAAPETNDATDRILSLLIPSDFITSLSKNYVPAVVTFALFYGIALQHVKEKQSLLAGLEAIRLASLAFWNAVVRLAPIAVFALFATTAGTLRVREFESITLFFALFFIGIFALTFWIVPGCIAAFAPIRYREIIRELRSAFLIAVTTTLSVAAVPFITAATVRLLERCGIEDPEKSDVVRTNISVAYPLGQLGNFFVYLFLIFAAFFYHASIPFMEGLTLPFLTFLSCVGSPTSSVDATAFLASYLHLPSEADELYVELMTLTRYGQVIVSVIGFAFLSFTVTLSYYGKLTIQWRKLLLPLAGGLAVVGGMVLGARTLFQHAIEKEPSPYLSFTLDPLLFRDLHVSFDPPPADEAPFPHESALSDIQRRGEIRIGYNDSIIPFCYRNSTGQLVGYDVSFAYKLAQDMNVRLRFIPFQWETLEADLAARRFDVAMAGIYVTEERLMNVAVSNPYYQSPLAFFAPRERIHKFESRASIESLAGLRIGVFDDPVLLPRLKRTFPSAQVIVVDNYGHDLDFTKFDAAMWTFEQAEALAAAHPNLMAAQPSGVGNPFLFAYLMPKDETELTGFVNYWLELQKSNGFEELQKNYWIKRMSRPDDTPRWSILRNVLGFGNVEASL